MPGDRRKYEERNKPANVPGNLRYQVCPVEAPPAGLAGDELPVGVGHLLGEKREVFDGAAAESRRVF